MPTLPTTFRIGALVFDIRYTENDRDLGSMDSDVGVIRVQRGQPPTAECDTLVHEILHALLWYGALSDIVPAEEVEERFIRRFAPLLHSAIVQNREVWDYVSNAGGS